MRTDKVAIFVFSGDEMTFVHALLNALEMEEKGYYVRIIIEGSATRLISKIDKDDDLFSEFYKKAKEYGLKNIRFLGMQPLSAYPSVVASSDVQLVTLNKNVKTPVVPSKILSTMAAARPVLASMPLDGDAPKLIEKSECGICVGPEDPEMIAKKIVCLSENREICEKLGKSGRDYVVKYFSLDKVAEEIEDMFYGLINTK